VRRDLVIIAHSFAGKTTSHRLGKTEDVEELPAYRAIKNGWGDPALVAMPEWHATARRAYNSFVRLAVQSSGLPLTVHPADEYHVREWLSLGCELRAVFLSHAELERRIHAEKRRKPDAPWWPSRLSGCLDGRRRILALRHVVPMYPDIDAALAADPTPFDPWNETE